MFCFKGVIVLSELEMMRWYSTAILCIGNAVFIAECVMVRQRKPIVTSALFTFISGIITYKLITPSNWILSVLSIGYFINYFGLITNNTGNIYMRLFFGIYISTLIVVLSVRFQ